MTEVLGTAAEWLGRFCGWLLRRETVSTVAELLGGTSIVAGLAGWSTQAALIVLGVMLIVASYRWTANSEE